MKIFLRILIIAAILLILVFLSIGIVRVVPKALSSLASATVSIGSVFGGNNASSTNTTSTDASATSTQNGAGFSITGTSTAGTSNTSANGANANGSKNEGVNAPRPYNNFIPHPAGTPTGSTGAASNAGTYSYTGAATTAAQACASNGTSDIAVTITSTGVKNSAGQFVTSSTFTAGDMVAVKFKVENRGVCVTGPWTLTVSMPAQNTADQSRTLSGAALAAGSAVTGEASFTSPRLGNSSVILTVADTSGKDSNAADNSASAAISVIAGTGSYGYNYNTYPYNYVTPTYGSGQPDLVVGIISVGTLDMNNNFTPVSNSNFPAGSRIAVKFKVTNQGLGQTGPWTFRASVNDTYQPQTYQDPQTENSLPSGGSSIYTVSFNNLGVGAHTMNLYADSYNQVAELNEGNNTLGVNFFVSGGYNGYIPVQYNGVYYNGNYNTYPYNYSNTYGNNGGFNYTGGQYYGYPNYNYNSGYNYYGSYPYPY